LGTPIEWFDSKIGISLFDKGHKALNEQGYIDTVSLVLVNSEPKVDGANELLNLGCSIIMLLGVGNSSVGVRSRLSGLW
jgi:hypothetical protein